MSLPVTSPGASSDAAEPQNIPSRSSTQSFRDSCDNCYKAKIKCSKTRPQCGRCINRGFECVYLPSRRRGRTKAVPGSNPCRNSPPSSRNSLTDCSTHSSSWDSYDDMILSKTPPDLSASTTPDLSSLDSYSDATLTPLDVSTHSLFADPDVSLFQGDCGSGTKVEMPSLSTSLSANSGIFNPACFGQGPSCDVSQTNNFTADCLKDEPCSFPCDSCDCLPQCLDALNTLFRATASWNAPPPFDVILTMNSRATTQLSCILNCIGCFSKGANSSLTMFLGTLLTKIMNHYQAAIPATNNSTGPTNNQSNSNNAGSGTSTSNSRSNSSSSNVSPFETSPTQLMLGSFPVNPGAEQRLKLDILRPELQKLRPLLDRFIDLCNRVRDKGSSSTDLLFQTLPENLESELSNLTNSFQQQNRRLAGQGFGVSRGVYW